MQPDQNVPTYPEEAEGLEEDASHLERPGHPRGGFGRLWTSHFSHIESTEQGLRTFGTLGTCNRCVLCVNQRRPQAGRLAVHPMGRDNRTLWIDVCVTCD